MQICLDYYRILGLPIQTSADAIEPAYSDRIQQLPQHDYSEAAIASRHDLLTEAYEVLSSPERRIRYDGLLLKTIRADAEASEEPTQESTPIEVYTPTLEITPDKLLGAFLLLHEVGEYQQILQLAQPYLDKPRVSFALGSSDEFELNQTQWRDLVLVSALAYLEIGREEWQKREYELAAHILESGKELLAKESLFNSVIQEIQTEIYKLRPYRILELISLEEEKVAERMQGLQMLKEMLDARGGINGSKNDRSGLTTEDFLRFIQQLRAYLTSVEQQALFESEARRPSEVSSYLAVCALIGRGFDQKQPALIAKAKEMLLQLSLRRDVHLERAICALLLRQIEEAGRAVELSSDEEAVNTIRQKSENDPDLLNGLCEYTEYWLSKEIYPYFRDLLGKRAVLKDYFLDAEVQEYLAQIHQDPAFTSLDVEEAPIETSVQTIQEEADRSNNNHNYTSVNTYGTRIARGNLDSPPARIIMTSSEGEDRAIKAPGEGRRGKRRTRPRKGRSRRPPSLEPILWGLLGLGILVSGIAWARSRQATPVVQTASQPTSVTPSPAASATTAPTPKANVAQLDKAQAKKIVGSWLEAKAQARGKEHKIDVLSNILAQPALNDQKRRAEGDLQAKSYWQYQHDYEIESVQPDSKNKNLATINARVKEKAQLYQAGKLNSAKSSNDDLLVRYKAIEQGGIWRIREIEVIN